jgi:hypothetical protein
LAAPAACISLGVRRSTAIEGVLMNIDINRQIDRSGMLYLPLLALALFACGCDSAPFLYEYHGSLSHPNGTPAAHVKVIAFDELSVEEFLHDRDFFRPFFEQFSTTTDVSGHFRGRCNGDGYTSWPWTDLFPPDTPTLDAVDVWVYEDNAWWAAHVPLNHASQQRTLPSCRWPAGSPIRIIQLPPLSFPSVTRNDSPISGWHSPDRQEQKP